MIIDTGGPTHCPADLARPWQAVLRCRRQASQETASGSCLQVLAFAFLDDGQLACNQNNPSPKLVLIRVLSQQHKSKYSRKQVLICARDQPRARGTCGWRVSQAALRTARSSLCGLLHPFCLNQSGGSYGLGLLLGPNVEVSFLSPPGELKEL